MSVAFDIDPAQRPLILHRIADLQQGIASEHQKMCKSKLDRDDYIATVRTRRFLNPLDVNLPWSGYERREKRNKQKTIEESMSPKRVEELDEDSVYQLSVQESLRALREQQVEDAVLEEWNEKRLQAARDETAEVQTRPCKPLPQWLFRWRQNARPKQSLRPCCCPRPIRPTLRHPRNPTPKSRRRR